MAETAQVNTEQHKEALFALEVVPPTGYSLPKKLTGLAFEHRFDVFCAGISYGGIYSGYLRVSADEQANRLARLFQHWIQTHSKVELEGDSDGFFYYVKFASTTGSAEGMDSGTTETLIHRLQSYNGCYTPFAWDTDELLTSETQLRVYYEVCGHTLPGNFRRWFRSELEKIKTDVSSTLKQQTIQALSMVSAIDWNKRKIPPIPPVKEFRAILDSTLHGMDSVKDILTGIAAQIKRCGSIPKWGVMFVGPPGVGKTAAILAFARALQMYVAFLDFSTVRDTEGLTGTFRIYENSRPGELFYKVFEARSPMFLLHIGELDKAAEGRKAGDVDPSTALLSLLDHTGLQDNYLGTTFPTDQILVVATANDTSKISKPLLDRFIVVNVPSYTMEEKLIIWDNYIHPRMLAEAQVPSSAFRITEDAKQLVLEEYAADGARELEKISQRLITNYCRSEDEDPDCPHTQYTSDDIRHLLGPSRVPYRNLSPKPGKVMGVSVLNGTVDFFLVEASVREGDGSFFAPAVFNGFQREYITVAYEALRSVCPADLTSLSITVSTPDSLPDTDRNIIGAAAFGAMWSAVTGTVFDPSQTAFFGGIDLLGSFYSDCTDGMRQVISALAGKKIGTLYAPLGSFRQIFGRLGDSCNISLIEMEDAYTFMTFNSNTHYR